MKTARLMYDCGADWRYATGVHASDPALWYQDPTGKTHLPTSTRDLAEYRAHAQADFVLDWTTIKTELAAASQPFNTVSIVQWLCAKDTPDVLEVPQSFPAHLYQQLKDAGLPVKTTGAELFFPSRAIKTPDEIAKLAEAQRINEQAFLKAFSLLREADIARDATLIWRGQALTSEILHAEMNKVLVEKGCTGFNHGPIVAGGAQGAAPHERGTGPLKAHQLIVIDCFPTAPNGYCGDLTRTVLKGKAPQWEQDVYHAVLTAQEVALSLLKPGVNGRDVHRAVEESFEKSGFKTGTDAAGNPYGFIHSTGHGLGLEVHDPGPKMLTKAETILQPGYVTTVEPGLYYPSNVNGGIGGCRIEDFGVITPTGFTNLTSLSKEKWVFD